MEIKLDVKKDDEDPDVLWMSFTVNGTRIGGRRLTFAESVELLGTIVLLGGMHEPQWCRDVIERLNRLLEGYREQDENN